MDILPCRKCGSTNYTYEDCNGLSSELTLNCNDCNNAEYLQICDALDYEERYSDDPDWQDPKTYKYGHKALEKAKTIIIQEWNMRVV